MKTLCLLFSLGVLLTSRMYSQGASVHSVQVPGVLQPLSFSTGGRVLVEPDQADGSFGGKRYTYQWPGTYFEAAFTGDAVDFRVGEGRQMLHVSIDGKPVLPWVSPGPGVYMVGPLPAARHTVRVEVATESQAGPDTFEGFALPPGGRPADAPRRAKEIEFIGDSHTVGYGNTSATRGCTPDRVWATTDETQAFGALTARHYDADYQVNAISGHGIVRNYNGSAGDPVPVAYPYVLFDRKQRYEDSAWQPQVVVIALGTNDFSTPLNPGERWKTREALHADYEATYSKFLVELRRRYPGAYLLLWATDGVNGEIQQEVAKVVAARKAAGETRLGFLPMNGLKMDACDAHPSLADDRTITAKLIGFMDAQPGIWAGAR